VVGIRPNGTREGASPDLSVTIVTNMGDARNAIIVWSADAVIVVGGWLFAVFSGLLSVRTCTRVSDG
jgi:hypothetical protein